MTYSMTVEAMEAEDREGFDAFLEGRTPVALAAVPEAAHAPVQEESNVEGLMAAFGMPQAPRGDNR